MEEQAYVMKNKGFQQEAVSLSEQDVLLTHPFSTNKADVCLCSLTHRAKRNLNKNTGMMRPLENMRLEILTLNNCFVL